MGVLSAITGNAMPFHWTETKQRTFDQVKRYVQACADHRRVPLDYGNGATPVWYMTDACMNGVAVVVAQGHEWPHARIAAFFSAKMMTTQQNYPIHEQEMLVGVEGMLRFRDILQGIKFTWLTDHKSLIHLYKQKNLSGRQAQWLEKISEFDFNIKYVPGEDNILPDALSRLYASDAPGTVRAASEYVHLADEGIDVVMSSLISMPVLVSAEARAEPVQTMESEPTLLRCSGRATKGKLREQLDLNIRNTQRGSQPDVTWASEHHKRPPEQPQDVGPSRMPALTGGHKRPQEQPQEQSRHTGPPRVPALPGGRKLPHQKKPAQPAETGRPEMASEFARHIKDHCVLRGPHEGTEGGNRDTTAVTHPKQV